MNVGASLLEAWQSLAANKMRSSLTILGIVIGVGAVIAMLAIGNGAQAAITGSITGVGSNLLFIYPGDMRGDMRNFEPLTMGDMDALRDPFQAPSVEAAAGEIQGLYEAVYAGQKTRVMVAGVTPEYAIVRNLKVLEGDFINATQMLENASVAVIGSDTARKLFDRTSEITGLSIRIDGKPFRIIGVLESRFSGMGNQDSLLIIPYTTAS